MKKENSTNEKVMIPIRLSNQLYKKVRNKVNNQKDKNRGYSINKYITELIEKNINN